MRLLLQTSRVAAELFYLFQKGFSGHRAWHLQARLPNIRIFVREDAVPSKCLFLHFGRQCDQVDHDALDTRKLQCMDHDRADARKPLLHHAERRLPTDASQAIEVVWDVRKLVLENCLVSQAIAPMRPLKEHTTELHIVFSLCG